MKIVIIGTGGVGGYFGGKLAQNKHDVYFFARNEQLNAIKNQGLRVKSVDGDFVISPAQASDKLTDFPTADLILVCTKVEQVKEIAPLLHHVMHENTVVIPLQNGLASEEILQQHIDYKSIIPGLCKIYSKIEAPGVIHHFGYNQPVIQIGENNKSLTPRILELVKTFNEAGFEAHAEEDIHLQKWKKFMFICSGGLLALTRSTYGEIRSYKPGRKMLKELFTEIYHVGVAKQINWDESVVTHAMRMVDAADYNATSSMQRDIDAKLPSELEYLNGAVVRFAYEMDMSVPLNEMIYKCLSVTEYYAGNHIDE
ncbi:MAG: 2-dehydropantoate 2-reductase [Flavobacteriaceae bacterium]|nr:2-dehydropantoate 2-reductase [Flavobacteriaceae bacterium]